MTKKVLGVVAISGNHWYGMLTVLHLINIFSSVSCAIKIAHVRQVNLNQTVAYARYTYMLIRHAIQDLY